MLDPSGCFQSTRMDATCPHRWDHRQKIARLVANTIAEAAYFKSTRKLQPTKSYADGLTIDYPCLVAKVKRWAPSSTL